MLALLPCAVLQTAHPKSATYVLKYYSTHYATPAAEPRRPRTRVPILLVAVPLAVSAPALLPPSLCLICEAGRTAFAIGHRAHSAGPRGHRPLRPAGQLMTTVHGVTASVSGPAKVMIR